MISASERRLGALRAHLCASTAPSQGFPAPYGPRSLLRSGINFGSYCFAEVVSFPERPAVLDLSQGATAVEGFGKAVWTVGGYDEKRTVYNTALYETTNGAPKRCIHVGVDLGGPSGTEVRAFADGEVFVAGYNPELGDYGNVVITRQVPVALKRRVCAHPSQWLECGCVVRLLLTGARA